MFFNKKEEVIDIELTQYGKYLLSKGKMKPAFYAFYDDDIIYDHLYGGVTEEQNQIEDRIRVDTPRLKTQYVYSGIETEVKRINEMVRSKTEAQRVDLGAESIQPTNDRNYALVSPLGTSDYNIEKAPSWSVTLHNGQIVQASAYKTISGTSSKAKIDKILNYPQLECQSVYETSINLEQIDTNDLAAGAISVDDLDFNTPDGAGSDFITIDEEFFLISIEEENTQFLLKNFDIEIFELEETKDVVNNKLIKSGDETLIPLNFLINDGQETRDRNYLNFDETTVAEEDALEVMVPSTTVRDVEYYFDIFIDNEIDPSILCEYVEDRSKGVFTDEFIDCTDITERDSIVEDMYDVETDESGEIC
tara:strand:- start:514 stop:1602 length:1089 start_codon:yes stop_codon:yes gene_type:complete